MSQRAVKTTKGGGAEVVHDAPIPPLKEGYILVETKAVALNPTDIHHMKGIAGPGSTLGVDFAGVVKDVGQGVTRFKIGDQVYGATRGGDSKQPECGAFAEIVTAKEFAVWHKPEHLSFEEAATFPVALATVGQAMFYLEKLGIPSVGLKAENVSKCILVYGGSSATGTVAIQFAKLTGAKVLTTCSPSNFDLVKSRGADHWFDYKDPATIGKIQDIVKDDLAYIIDCIGSNDTAAMCAQLLSREGGTYHSVLFPPPVRFKELRPEENAKMISALGYTFLGETFEYGSVIKVPEEGEVAYAQKWNKITERLVNEGLVEPHRQLSRPGGLEGVVAGLQELATVGSPSGKKIVYSV